MDNRAPGLDVIGLDPDDLREHYEERAAIKEYCGGLPRHAAEASAWNEVNLEHRKRLARARNG